jgi:predicted nucleic acid-binding protein
MPDADAVVVADTSVIINLNATEQAAEILSSLPFRIVLTDIVAAELTEDRRNGRRDAELLAALVTAGHTQVVSLGEAGLEVFGELVIGPAAETLDDGEASTIAYAVEHGLAPVIDERKGLKICGARFPLLRPKSTVDLFADPAVVSALGRDRLGDAAFLALRNARMRVAVEHLGWVVELIGVDRATLCPSLPKAARRG